MPTSQKVEKDKYELISVWDTDAKNYGEFNLPYKLFDVPTEELSKNAFWRNLFIYAKSYALEAGCGTGKNSLVLTKIGVSSVLLDFSRDTILYCKELFRRCSCEGFFVVADLMHLPFKEAAFSFVHSDSSLEHVVGFKEAIREIARVTHIGGFVFVTVPNKMRLDGSDLHKKLARVEHMTTSFSTHQLRDSFQTEFLVVKIFGYDVISPGLMILIRSATNFLTQNAAGSMSRLRNNAEHAAAKHARYEAGYSILETVFLKWLDGPGLSQRLIRNWLISEQPCFLGFNLCIIAKKITPRTLNRSHLSRTPNKKS
jgi:ubiquinone/menaquinone biosynthesis C-methylase UbiE